jgi:hypothetical protein
MSRHRVPLPIVYPPCDVPRHQIDVAAVQLAERLTVACLGAVCQLTGVRRSLLVAVIRPALTILMARLPLA